ncbi:hypothetical protein HOH45_02025 [bacterium]|nr:hypothetical protein [bacterium]
MINSETSYLLIDPDSYRDFANRLVPKLSELKGNRVTFKNEIHRISKFAICHYLIDTTDSVTRLTYDTEKSLISSNQKKTYSDPELLNDPLIETVLITLLKDIGDDSISRAEVKLIQTHHFPFIFNPHRDSQFKRLRHISYLATLILSSGGLEGGNMQLFHSENDKLGPFQLIEELPLETGVGYVVDERERRVFHGMKPAYKTDETAHRAALLIRFYNGSIGGQK